MNDAARHALDPDRATIVVGRTRIGILNCRIADDCRITETTIPRSVFFDVDFTLITPGSDVSS